MYLWRIGCLAAWLAFASAHAGAQDANTFEIYPLGGGDAAATEQLVRQLAGPDAHVVLDAPQQRLLVLAAPSQHARIAEAMKKLVVVPRNVRIEVAFSSSGENSEQELSVSGGGDVVREEGITSTRFRIRPRVIDQSGRTSREVQQTLLVASGREAALRVGEQVPYLDWLLDYGRHQGVVIGSMAWQEVGSFLVVEPTVVGEGPMIRVRLTPELSGTVQGEPLRTRFAQVATEVVVADGQTFELGGMNEHADFYNRFLVGFRKGGTAERLSIRLTPHILDVRDQITPTAPPPGALR